MSDPFGDLADLESGDDGDDDTAEAEQSFPDSPEAGDEPSGPDRRDPLSKDPDPVTIPEEPAFDYDAVDQGPLYAREDSWNGAECALDEARLELRREYDLHDVAKRELHDALLRVVEGMGSDIAEAVVEERKR